MNLPAQSAAVPPTVKVNVSQLRPSWHRSSGATSPNGAFRAPPPVAVPVHVTGAAVGLIVAPAGPDADVFVSAGSIQTSDTATKPAAINVRSATRALHRYRRRLTDREIVGVITALLFNGCRAAEGSEGLYQPLLKARRNNYR